MTTQMLRAPGGALAQSFEWFHRENPHVYVVLVRLANEWMDRTGRHSLGAKALLERARWELALTTTDPDFKLNNNYTAFYARLIMTREPRLDGMFQLRSSDADEWMDNLRRTNSPLLASSTLAGGAGV